MADQSSYNGESKASVREPVKRTRRGTNPRSLANLKPIKKGQVLNPTGNPVNKELSKVKRLTRNELVEIGTRLLQGNVSELMELAEQLDNPNVSAIEVMTANVVKRVIQRGDMVAYNAILDRIVGKVSDRLEIEVNRPQVLITLPDNQREIKQLPSAKESPQVIDIVSSVVKD